MEKKRVALRKLLEAVEKEILRKPDKKVLDRLSLLAGFQDWKSFQDALHGDVSADENLFLFTNVVALLLNTGSLTSELAQIVKLSAANLTNLVDLDALNVGRLDGEDTLYTNGTRHLANSEALLVFVT